MSKNIPIQYASFYFIKNKSTFKDATNVNYQVIHLPKILHFVLSLQTSSPLQCSLRCCQHFGYHHQNYMFLYSWNTLSIPSKWWLFGFYLESVSHFVLSSLKKVSSAVSGKGILLLLLFSYRRINIKARPTTSDLWSILKIFLCCFPLFDPFSATHFTFHNLVLLLSLVISFLLASLGCMILPVHLQKKTRKKCMLDSVKCAES